MNELPPLFQNTIIDIDSHTKLPLNKRFAGYTGMSLGEAEVLFRRKFNCEPSSKYKTKKGDIYLGIEKPK
jgi:hypothetical protein